MTNEHRFAAMSSRSQDQPEVRAVQDSGSLMKASCDRSSDDVETSAMATSPVGCLVAISHLSPR